MFRKSTGRHCAPIPPSHTARVVAASVAALGLGLLTAGTASAAPTTAVDLDSIAACESGGNAQASNGSHFGLFQFDLATWRSVGGSGDPRNASVAEQYQRASALMASRGTQPWTASQSCWGTKKLVVKNEATPTTKKVTLPKAAPKHAAPPKAAPKHSAPAVAAGDTYTVLAGDTLSRIAAMRGDGSWQKLFAKNRSVVNDPDLIFVGQELKV